MEYKKTVMIVLSIMIVSLLMTAIFLALQINKNNAPANSSANSPISQDDAIAFCKARVPSDPTYHYTYSGIGGGGCGPAGSCSSVQISLDCIYVDEAQSKVLRQNYCINATACGYPTSSSSSSSAPSGQIQCGLCGYTMTTQSQCDNIRNWSNANACSCASKYDLRTESYDPSKNVNCTSGGGTSSSTSSTGGGTLPFNKICGEPCGIYAGGLCTGGSICRYVNGPACSASGIGTYCLPINLPSGWTQANCVSRDQGNLYVLNSGQNPTVSEIQSICSTSSSSTGGTPLPNTGIEDGLGYLIFGLIFILFGGSFYLEFLNKRKVVNS